MTAHPAGRWFQLSLKSLFGLTLLVATFFAGYSLATKQAEAERRRAEAEAQRAMEAAQLESARAQNAVDAFIMRALVPSTSPPIPPRTNEP